MKIIIPSTNGVENLGNHTKMNETGLPIYTSNKSGQQELSN